MLVFETADPVPTFVVRGPSIEGVKTHMVMWAESSSYINHALLSKHNAWASMKKPRSTYMNRGPNSVRKNHQARHPLDLPTGIKPTQAQKAPNPEPRCAIHQSTTFARPEYSCQNTPTSSLLAYAQLRSTKSKDSAH